MKRIIKWLAIVVSTMTVLVASALVAIIYICNHPPVEPVPDGFTEAMSIWTCESELRQVDLKKDGKVVTILVNPATTYGTLIQYPDEQEPRDLFAQELYFGAIEIRHDENSDIVYLMIAGMNPVLGPRGKRIIEYDVRLRRMLRDYWVEVSG